MNRSSLKIATVWGIPIRIHVSVLVMVVFLCTQFGFVWGLMLEVALGASIILHELGHCYVALRKNCPVRDISLMVIGGAAQMERIPRKPRDEFLMAIAGPAVSLVLAILFTFLARVIPMAPIPNTPWTYLELIAALNTMLVLFNLLPAFPMDGGRVLRAALSPRLGRLRATAIAARLGKLLALLFLLYGIVASTITVQGGAWGFNMRALLFAAIGFFVYMAAEGEYFLVRVQEGDLGPNDKPDFFRRKGPFENSVSISPPPYTDGPGDSAEIKSTKKHS